MHFARPIFSSLLLLTYAILGVAGETMHRLQCCESVETCCVESSNPSDSCSQHHCSAAHAPATSPQDSDPAADPASSHDPDSCTICLKLAQPQVQSPVNAVATSQAMQLALAVIETPACWPVVPRTLQPRAPPAFFAVL